MLKRVKDEELSKRVKEERSKRVKCEVKEEWRKRVKQEVKQEPKRQREVKNERETCTAMVPYEGSSSVKRKNVLPEKRQPKTSTEKKKRKRTKKAKPSEKRKEAANRLVSLSPALQRVVGAQELSAGTLVSRMWQTMKERGLQNPMNGKEMILDEELSSLLGYQTCAMLDLRCLLRPHMIFPADKVANETTSRMRDEFRREFEAEAKEEVKMERMTKQELKEEMKLERLCKKEEAKHEIRARSNSFAIPSAFIDVDDDIDVYSIGSSSSSTTSEVTHSDAQTEVPPRWNVTIQSVGRATFKFFIADEELERVPSTDAFSSSLVWEDTRHDAAVTRVEGGYEASFMDLQPDKKYNLYIRDYYQFQVPFRAIDDFTVATAAEFCAFFDTSLSHQVRQKCIDGRVVAQWKMDDLIQLAVKAECADRILAAIRGCM